MYRDHIQTGSLLNWVPRPLRGLWASADRGVTVPIDEKVRLPDGSYFVRGDDGSITVPLPPPQRRGPPLLPPPDTNLLSAPKAPPRAVRATVGGVVGNVGWQDPKRQRGDGAGMGWRIYLNQPDGSRIGYGHMDPASTLKPGTRVNPGDIIGQYAAPTNGRSNAPHVHVQKFDRRKKVVDPGDESPLVRRGRRTSRFRELDSMHAEKPHQGNDWVEETQ